MKSIDVEKSSVKDRLSRRNIVLHMDPFITEFELLLSEISTEYVKKDCLQSVIWLEELEPWTEMNVVIWGKKKKNN